MTSELSKIKKTEEYKKFIRYLIEELLSNKEKIEELDAKRKKQKVEDIKAKSLRKFDLNIGFPPNSDILALATDLEKKQLSLILRKKPIRTLSGVAVVAVMTSPEPCPHGKCSFCPGGKESVFGDVPQSYTGKEPATMRGIMYKFDPYIQTSERLAQLEKVGHPTDKVELIIMGGTFPGRDIEYQENFIKGCLDAMNGVVSESLEEAQKINETAPHRCVALTIETRPDYCKEEHIDEMLKLGATRIELGIQSTYDEVLDFVKRGHSVSESINATSRLKNSGLKVSYHLIPGLPHTTEEMDRENIKRVFDNPGFKPDLIKFYPCLVIEGTELYDLWKKGEYKPISDEEAVELVTYAKSIMPKWIRTSRIQRDIPATVIDEGVKKSNLGELVYKNLEEKGIKCKCIRCREVGHVCYKKGIKPDLSSIKLLVEEYEASGGKEFFISYEDVKNDLLIGYLRLRIPDMEAVFRPEIDKDTALIRQVHVCGQQEELGSKIEDTKNWQHKGYGKLMLEEAEKIAKSHGKSKILITSGIGVREYYKKQGYNLIGAYMGKKLN
ncbi:tRNA uridine(34) 5-carboxymethylaminomethyl modification radical SAM/GNAT enzyme Elp3 [Methanococcus voltae]|uniref:tRNA carboxymethyluridine synthase n=1 Tax=Methanococcus voltae TaxID=2188 RepID=A0A8J7URP2_METVO|nr:tRNA uridine(34) 5-carboxymethylaminomethyl modification radical SAM/GNAT enzyme Elp3 [Methanococcus voltae]MBP2172211.1 elongator complex protein 3 [Methanococcus voltae]MBP2200832.1 elongator complex protein 3 [Methanococcus voltae]